MKALLDDGNQDVDRHGDPDLAFHRVLACPVERFDSQMLLDPFEEKLHLPPATIEVGDGYCGHREVVSQEIETPILLGIVVLDAAQFVGICGRGFLAREEHGLIAHDPYVFIDGIGIDTSESCVALRSDHEERSGFLHGVESSEIQVCAIHDVEGSGFRNENIQDVDVVAFSV